MLLTLECLLRKFIYAANIQAAFLIYTIFLPVSTYQETSSRAQSETKPVFQYRPFIHADREGYSLMDCTAT
jgi:hypothetical protein